MIVCGVDIGFKGSMAFIESFSGGFRFLESYEMPTIKDGKKNRYNAQRIISIFKEHNPGVVGVEKGLLIPRSGKMAYFHNGYGEGMFNGILTSMGLRFEFVHPKAWQKVVLSHTGNTKGQSLLFARQMFPDAVLETVRGRQLDGVADALCIATYMSRSYK